MTHAFPPLTKDLIEAFAASAIAWAVRFLGVLVRPRAGRRRSVRALLKWLERAVESILFLSAVHCFGPVPRSRRRRPASVPAGFRRTMGNRRLFLKCARIRARGADPLTRVGRLLEALAHPERYIARFMRRFMRGVNFVHLVACAPAAAPCASLACPDARFADSS